jgi:hypothetical protein
VQLDRFDTGVDVLFAGQPLDDHRAEALHELAEVDLLVAALGQDLVHGRNREDAVDGVGERLLGIRAGRTGLESEQ